MTTSAVGLGQRVTIAAAELAICGIVYFEHTSLLHKVLESADVSGTLFFLVMLGCSTLSLIDAVVTDMLPRNISIPSVYSARMQIHMLKAVLNLGLAFTLTQASGGPWAGALNAILAASCVWVAVVDTLHYYVMPRQKSQS